MPNEIQLTDEQIRTRAYYLWEADGRPQGRDWEYWLRAKAECAQPSVTTAKAATNGPAKKASAATAAETPRKRTASRAPAFA